MPSTNTLLVIVALLGTIACSDAYGQAAYTVQKTANPEFRSSEIFYRFEDITSPPFVELRRRFALADVARSSDDEFQRILLLRHWIFTTLKVDQSKPQPSMDAISILAQGPSGGPFECSHTTLVQNAVMNAMGYVTRCLQPGPGEQENTYLAAGNHGVNEIWSNTYCKWFVSDAEFDGHFEKAGIPLSALEIRDEYLKDGAKSVDLVVGLERKKVQPQLLFNPHCYRFVAYELAGDRHTQSQWSVGAPVVWEDEYFKTHTWYRWGAPLNEKPRPHWAIQYNAFLRTAHREWIEWTPNVTKVQTQIQGNVARVHLVSNTPNFARYEMRRAGQAWEKTDIDSSVKLEGQKIELEFRAVNLADVAGPTSSVVIEQK